MKSWSKHNIGELCTFTSGGTPSRKNPESFKGPVPWMTSVSLKKTCLAPSDAKELLAETAIRDSAAKIIPPPCVLVGTRVGIGNASVAEFLVSFSQDVVALKFDTQKLNPTYLAYFIRQKKPQLHSQARGSTIMGISAQAIKALEILLPPIDIQRRIVEILERAERLRERRESANEDMRKILQSIFTKMFGDPGTNPKGLEVATLLELSSEKPRYGSGASAVSFDGKTRYIRITDIDEEGNLREERVSPSEFDEKYLLQKGDLLFARSGATVGKTHTYTNDATPAIYAGYLIRFRFNPRRCRPDFVYAITRSSFYQEWVKHTQTQVAQPNLNAQQYGAFKIVVPSLEEQDKFVSIYEMIQSAMAKQQVSDGEIDSLFDALLTKAFSGELVS